MDLSIIIVNWNATKLLTALIESIYKCSPKELEKEIIVVDNDSNDFDLVYMSETYPVVNFIKNNENTGYAAGNNQGLEIATGKYILLLNPDIELTENTIKPLISFLEKYPKAEVAGAKLVRPDGSVDKSLRSFPYPLSIIFESVGLARLFPKSRFFASYRMTYFEYNRTIEVDQPMGSCLMIKKEVIDKVGIMDENFPIFFNDVDLLYRIKAAGYKVFFVHNAVAVHHGAASTSQADKKRMQYESYTSLLKFYKKHFSYGSYILANLFVKTIMLVKGLTN